VRDSRSGLMRHSYDGTYVLQSMDPTDPTKHQTATTGYRSTISGRDLASYPQVDKTFVAGNFGYEQWLSTDMSPVGGVKGHPAEGSPSAVVVDVPFTLTYRSKNNYTFSAPIGTICYFPGDYSSTLEFYNGPSIYATYPSISSGFITSIECQYLGSVYGFSYFNYVAGYDAAGCDCYGYQYYGVDCYAGCNCFVTDDPTYIGGNSNGYQAFGSSGIKFRQLLTSPTAHIPVVYADAITASLVSTDLPTAAEPVAVEHPIAHVNGAWTTYSSWLSTATVYDPALCAFVTAIPSPDTSSAAPWTSQISGGGIPFHVSDGVQVPLFYVSYGLHLGKVVSAYIFNVNLSAFSISGTATSDASVTVTECHVPTDYARCAGGGHTFAPVLTPAPVCASVTSTCYNSWNDPYSCLVYTVGTIISPSGSFTNVVSSPVYVGAGIQNVYGSNADGQYYIWGGAGLRTVTAYDVERIGVESGPPGMFGAFPRAYSTACQTDPTVCDFDSELGNPVNLNCVYRVIETFTSHVSTPQTVDISSQELPLDRYWYNWYTDAFLQGSQKPPTYVGLRLSFLTTSGTTYNVRLDEQPDAAVTLGTNPVQYGQNIDFWVNRNPPTLQTVTLFPDSVASISAGLYPACGPVSNASQNDTLGTFSGRFTLYKRQ
jgi:hypothetical protein